MNNSPTSKTLFITGKQVLLPTTFGLLVSALAIMALGIFGTTEQFAREKDMLPPIIGILTPLLSAAVAFYLKPPSS